MVQALADFRASDSVPILAPSGCRLCEAEKDLAFAVERCEAIRRPKDRFCLHLRLTSLRKAQGEGARPPHSRQEDRGSRGDWGRLSDVLQRTMQGRQHTSHIIKEASDSVVVVTSTSVAIPRTTYTRPAVVSVFVRARIRVWKPVQRMQHLARE